MRQIKTIYVLLLALLLTIASCKNDNSNSVTLYSDATITAFSLGTLNRYVNGTKLTLKGSNYHFNIDQVSRIIYNSDSLPIGTDAAHVICNVTALNNGWVGIVDLEDANTAVAYSSLDSIDFTTDRQFVVYASDGSGYTQYTVKVNVHKEDGEVLVWKQLGNLPSMTGLKAVSLKDQLYVFGNEGGQTKAYSIDNNGIPNAVSLPALSNMEAWSDVTASSDNLYLLDGTTLWHSSDMVTWISETLSDVTLKQLVGASTKELYALSADDRLLVRRGSNTTWEEDFMDEVGLLPTQDFALVCYPMELADNTDNVLWAGNRQMIETDDNGSNVKAWRTMMWRKLADHSKDAPIGHWAYMERADNNRYALPAMKNLQLISYDDAILAFGGATLETTSQAPYSTIYKSRDNGITWRKETGIQLPTDFNKDENPISAIVDKDNYIWLFCSNTGDVWRGRLNRLGWK